jgi:LDH2 family malate/lactate/ureidoglycolate dehydrogenase
MAFHAMLALASDMIGLATTNALPTMAPWGGAEKIVGINPLGVAIPADEEPPIVFDGAFSGSAHGKIRVYGQKGLPLPEGWAFDSHGAPTTDAEAALEGLLQPIGGFKGVGLAIVFGVLSSLLSGAAYGTELGNMVDGPRAGQDGHLFVAINVAAFQDVANFKGRVDGIVRQIRSSRRAAGVERLYAPGEIEYEAERRYAVEGIPLASATIDELIGAAGRLGVSVARLT